jgi:hypothetical protein
VQGLAIISMRQWAKSISLELRGGRKKKKRLPERAAEIELRQCLLPTGLAVETCARRTAKASGGALSAGKVVHIFSRYRHQATKGAAKRPTEPQLLPGTEPMTNEKASITPYGVHCSSAHQPEHLLQQVAALGIRC